MYLAELQQWSEIRRTGGQSALSGTQSEHYMRVDERIYLK